MIVEKIAYNKLPLLLFICFSAFSGLQSQNNIKNNSVNCDSIHTSVSTMVCEFVDNLPSPVIPFPELQNEFIKLVDTSICKNTILINVLIDTLGNVLCPNIHSGNFNITDTIALNFISSIQFNPAIASKKKVAVRMGILFYGSKVNETKDYIKIGGKWMIRSGK